MLGRRGAGPVAGKEISNGSKPGTRFGSLERYEKGGVEVINDDARNYVFSNVFEVA